MEFPLGIEEVSTNVWLTHVKVDGKVIYFLFCRNAESSMVVLWGASIQVDIILMVW